MHQKCQHTRHRKTCVGAFCAGGFHHLARGKHTILVGSSCLFGGCIGFGGTFSISTRQRLRPRELRRRFVACDHGRQAGAERELGFTPQNLSRVGRGASRAGNSYSSQLLPSTAKKPNTSASSPTCALGDTALDRRPMGSRQTHSGEFATGRIQERVPQKHE